MPLGLYISLPFCRTKCSYCNFASGVFSRAHFGPYIDRLLAEIEDAPGTAERMGGVFERAIDSTYFGGGTPTLLDVAQLDRVFVTLRQNFDLADKAEITMECAPGTLSEDMLSALVRWGVNRVSLGVQSFIDKEAAAIGRLHNRDLVFADIARLRNAGITNINLDMIAGLPHQTRESWVESVDQLIRTGAPHASIYMLEVDEDSRLGRELLAGGERYHAHFVPDEDLTAELYEIAAERLHAVGLEQYEISNFARPDFESKHNLKYWTRRPYLGFGADAHSMLALSAGREAVRFSNPDSVEGYRADGRGERILVSAESALQEEFFLGLRLNRGVNFEILAHQFGVDSVAAYSEAVAELVAAGLVERSGSTARLTARGRLLSNEVFERFISVDLAV
jgi:oxygen-independent coproporphyrinogen III oxidase